MRTSSISRMAWPLGSRIITAFLNPSLACASCGMSTTSGLMNCAPVLRKRSVAAPMSLVTSVVCHCQRSLALVSLCHVLLNANEFLYVD